MSRALLLVSVLGLGGCSVTLGYDGLQSTGPEAAGGSGGAAGVVASAGSGGQPAANGGGGGAGAGQAGASAGAAGVAAGTGGSFAGQAGTGAGQAGTSGGGVGGAGQAGAGAVGGGGQAGGGLGGEAGAAALYVVEEVALSPISDPICGFVVDDDEVFWATSKELYKLPLAAIPKSGPEPKPQKMSGTNGVGVKRTWGLSQLGDRLYWSDDNGNLCTAGKADTNVDCTKPLFATKDTKPEAPGHALAAFSLAGKSYLLAVFEGDALSPGSASQVGALPLDASGGTMSGAVIRLGDNDQTMSAMAAGRLDGGNVYVAWPNNLDLYGERFTSAPKLVNKTASLLTAVRALDLSGDASTLAIGIDAAVYRKITVPSTDPTAVADGLELVKGVAFPGVGLPDTIFAGESARGRILALPAVGPKQTIGAGTSPYTIIEGQLGLYALKSAGPYLYWFTSYGAESRLRRARVR